MLEQTQIEIRRESDIVTARTSGRDLAHALGFSLVECTQIATAISELARNIISYADNGELTLRIVTNAHQARGIEIVTRDSGPGIDQIDVAMRDGYSTSNGLGLGLPGTKRLMDEFELGSTLGMGTVVRATKWLKKADRVKVS